MSTLSSITQRVMAKTVNRVGNLNRNLQKSVKPKTTSVAAQVAADTFRTTGQSTGSNGQISLKQAEATVTSKPKESALKSTSPTLNDMVKSSPVPLGSQSVTTGANGVLMLDMDQYFGMNLGTNGSTGSIDVGGPSRSDGPIHLSRTDLNFDQAQDVVSSAQKFILPVPKFEGEPLVYPKGATDKDGASIAGQDIKDWQGKPIAGPGETGVVFFNGKDNAWQAVKSDGNGVIIMNQATEEQAKQLQNKIGAEPGKLKLEEFKSVLEFASAAPSVDSSGTTSGLGLSDMYNSDRDFIKSKMNVMETSDTGVPQYGLHRRDDRDVCQALFIEGQGTFQGPSADLQKFDDGAVILRQPDSKAEDGFSYRLIQPDAFEQTYSNKDGKPIDLNLMPRH